MTTSGTRDFEPDVAEYIEEAFERCGLEFRTGYDGITARREGYRIIQLKRGKQNNC